MITLAERRAHFAPYFYTSIPCLVCERGLHEDGGVMCPAHADAPTHHYCNNGCADCARLREERAA